MEYKTQARIIQGVGGLYRIALLPSDAASPLRGQTISCRARGALRYHGLTPLPGDVVSVSYDDTSFAYEGERPMPYEDGRGVCINDILPRSNALIRPPMANLGVLFVTLAAAAPAPLLPTVDKLISIAEHTRIEPVIVVTKADLDKKRAEELRTLYEKAGFSAFALSTKTDEGVDGVERLIRALPDGSVAAFAGASGVGKSTLMNRLFPSLGRLTGEISQKSARGRHTTREVTLFALSELLGDASLTSYVADTPGFSLLDFTRFDFFEKEDLVATMRDFAPYLGQCRYTDCTHTKEQDCAIVQAVLRGDIAPSRHESFLSMYYDLKDKHPWTKPPSHH